MDVKQELENACQYIEKKTGMISVGQRPRSSGGSVNISALSKLRKS